MNPQTLKYLQNDEVGKVIATGLATLYMNKPQKPIKYLAQWLKAYSRNQKQMNNLVHAERSKKQVIKSYEQETATRHKIQKDLQAKQQEVQKSHEDFKQTIADHEYAEDLLEQTLAEFLQQNTSATGVYIGQLNYPPKQVTDEDTDESAHLNTTADKMINYIGSSVSHKQLMRGKSLKTTQGVTASSFALLEQAPPVVGEDGQQAAQAVTLKYTFVPNVVKNDAITYFKIPKLGSYLAVPIICSEYLTEANFDQALKEKQEYLKQCEELEKARKAELEELHKQKQEIQKKIADLTEKNGDEAHLKQLHDELKQTEEAIAQKEKQSIEYKHPTLVANKKSFVICADTLGKDKPFEQSQIDFISSIAHHFQQSWSNKEKQLLDKDIDNHISGLHNLKIEPQALKQELIRQIEPTEEEQKQIAGITEQNKKTHKQLELQISKLKHTLKQNPIYLESFLHLKKMRVLKYKQLVQNILFFLGYKKAEVNTPKRASLDWRHAREKYITQHIFDKILSYNPVGPKKQQFTVYGKTPHLADTLDKFDEQEVFKYNAALGAITIFVKKALELRQTDVEVRKAKFQEDTKNREKIIEENQKINAKLTEELEKHKSSLSPEQAQNFKEQPWKEQFYAKTPLHEVPGQIHHDIDNDM